MGGIARIGLDILTFVVEMTKALAWPAAAVCTVLFLRHPLVRLVGLLRTVKYGDWELGFNEQVIELERKARETLPQTTTEPRLEDLRARLLKIAVNSPAAAVIEAWRHVEQRLHEVAQDHELKVAPAVEAMPLVLGALMFKRDIITDAQYSLLQRAKTLRDTVAHSLRPDLSVDEVSKFISLCIRLLASLK